MPDYGTTLMSDRSRFPLLPLGSLDTVWFQIAGTLCNLRCHHCFISCAPDNHTLELISLDDFHRHLAEAARLGVKEYYFTGGEPFIHPQILDILEAALAVGPVTVLTNATRLNDEKAARLAALHNGSIYSLELRVSIDGFSAETNDPIRGAGTFDLAMRGLRALVAHHFLPIITAMRSWPIDQDEQTLAAFKRALAEIGYLRPRLKLLPSLKIGQEAARTGGYETHDFITEEMMSGYDAALLLCHNSRVVTDRGVFVCPILVDQPSARLGESLHHAMQPFRLRHQACSTCYRYGALCSNATGVESTRGIDLQEPKVGEHLQRWAVGVQR